MEAYKREFIEFLQGAGVLKFGDFTAKSGRKIPYFVNAGMIKTGDQISKMGEFYAKAYFDKLGKKPTVLYGPAYKGIPLSISAAVALSKNGLDVPFFFNRKEVKDHGEGGTFVGYVPTPGEEIVIIEDVITAGTAIRVYDFTRSLINSIERDMENNGKVEPARYYAITKMLKLIGPVKSYEDEVISEKQKLQEEKPKGLTPDLIREIEEQILVITHEEICEHDLNTD